MEKKISVIIPVHNSFLTLKECLDAIYNSNYKNFEVIVVDDHSSDNSLEIAKQFKCKIIELKENGGPAYARNTGAYSAENDILFFIDSDVIIQDNSLNHINNIFNDEEHNVVQGVYSHKPNYKSIFSQYQQSFYCYYTWHKNITNVSAFCSMCFAIRKKTFFNSKQFNTKIRRATVEDEEFGYNLIDMGNLILLLRELQVEHRVNYDLKQYIKRNFIAYFDTMKSYLRNKNLNRRIKQNNYLGIILSLPVFGSIILTLITMIFFSNEMSLTILLVLNIFFLSLHLKFIGFVSSEKGLRTAFGVVLVCYLDTFLMLIGAGCACISYIVGRKY